MSTVQSQYARSSLAIFSLKIIAAFLLLLIASHSYAIDWNQVPVINHSVLIKA